MFPACAFSSAQAIHRGSRCAWLTTAKSLECPGQTKQLIFGKCSAMLILVALRF